MNELILTKTSIAYPVYQIETTYKYRKVEKPTIFDELLMGLASDFPELKNNSLEQICSLMQLDKVFIKHTLDNLLSLGLIQQLYGYEELSNIKIEDLKLTENGKKFYLEKKMPSRMKIATEQFFLDSLNQAFENKPSNNYDKNTIQLDENLFPAHNDTLNKLSTTEMPNFKWYDSNVSLEVNGLSHTVENTQWKSVNINLSIDHNRNIAIKSQNKDFQSWLDARASTVIEQNILTPIFNQAKNSLSNQMLLDCNISELNSLVLADTNTDLSSVKNSVLGVFNYENIPENIPCIMLDDMRMEAQLSDKVLFVPHKNNIKSNINNLFFNLVNGEIFGEQEGILKGYFDHQSIDIPVKTLAKFKNNTVQDFSAFQNPNIDTLVFLANYLSENDIIEKLPKLNIEQIIYFKEKLNKTWNKNFSENALIERINKLKTTQELNDFRTNFKKSTLKLSQLDDELQKNQLDEVLQNPKSLSSNFIEFTALIKLSTEIGNVDHLSLKQITSKHLKNLGLWDTIKTELLQNFPALSDSTELNQKSNRIKKCETMINQSFEPIQIGKKFAVLDTNYIRSTPKKLEQLKNESIIIIPNIVLDELDSQKEKQKKEEIKYQNELDNMQQTLALLEDKIITENINKLKEEIESLKKSNEKNTEFNIEITHKEKQLSELRKQKKDIDNKIAAYENDIKKINEKLQKVKASSFEVRETIRNIEELKLSEYVEIPNRNILAMLENANSNKATNSENDDKILAIAARYKLNDVTLYTHDKNLKNKATSIGIKTI